MIEQLISVQGTQDAFISEVSKQPNPVNDNDVMRFNMELSEGSSSSASNSHLLQDVRVDTARIDNDLLTMSSSEKDSTVSNPLTRLDSAYRDIMSQLNDVPQFDKFYEITQNDKAPAVRTNVVETEALDPKEQVQKMLEEMREVRVTAGEFSKDISKWHMTTQIWSANIKILTTVVSQASQGFKTLFRSAG